MAIEQLLRLHLSAIRGTHRKPPHLIRVYFEYHHNFKDRFYNYSYLFMASIELEPTNTGILKMKDCLSLRDFDRIIPLSDKTLMVLVSLDKNLLLLVYAFHNNALNFANFHNAGKENLLDVQKQTPHTSFSPILFARRMLGVCLHCCHGEEGLKFLFSCNNIIMILCHQY